MHVASLDKFGVSVLLIDLYKVYTSTFLVAYGMDLAVFLLTKKVFRLPDWTLAHMNKCWINAYR